MNRIPLLCISLLIATVFILQTTKPQTHVIYLASETNTMKVRPVGYTATDMKVVSAEEATKRFVEANGSLMIRLWLANGPLGISTEHAISKPTRRH